MRKAKPHPSQEQLRALFDYRADGFLIWKERQPESLSQAGRVHGFNTQFAGKVAGGLKKEGYCHISIGNISFLAHRLIWIWHFGDIPDGLEIDHKDGLRARNVIDNLESGTSGDNNKNSALQKNNTSGHCGVVFSKREKKWAARANVNGKRKHLGYFLDKEVAAATVAQYRAESGFSERHGQ